MPEEPPAVATGADITGRRSEQLTGASRRRGIGRLFGRNSASVPRPPHDFEVAGKPPQPYAHAILNTSPVPADLAIKAANERERKWLPQTQQSQVEPAPFGRMSPQNVPQPFSYGEFGGHHQSRTARASRTEMYRTMMEYSPECGLTPRSSASGRRGMLARLRNRLSSRHRRQSGSGKDGAKQDSSVNGRSRR